MFAFSTDNAAAKGFFPAALSANMANDRKLLVGGESLRSAPGHRSPPLTGGQVFVVEEGFMGNPGEWVTVGIDNGGTSNNGTVLDSRGHFLVETMAELPSLVREGPDKAIGALVDTFGKVLAMTGVPRELVRAVGLDTPGPASATACWRPRARRTSATRVVRVRHRAALEERLGIPVIYNNDANAAALYAHHVRYGARAPAAQLGVRDRRDRPRWRCRRQRADHLRRGGHGGRARSHADPAWTACSRTGSRCRPATAACSGTRSRWPRLPGSPATCCPTG